MLQCLNPCISHQQDINDIIWCLLRLGHSAQRLEAAVDEIFQWLCPLSVCISFLLICISITSQLNFRKMGLNFAQSLALSHSDKYLKHKHFCSYTLVQ